MTRKLTYNYNKEKISCTCIKCGKSCSRLCDLSRHLGKAHHITLEEYYCDVVNPGLVPNKCVVCGKNTSFDTVHLEYRKYCSQQCERVSVERGRLTSETLHTHDLSAIAKKRSITNLEKYGSACSIHCPEVTAKKIASIRKRYTEETGIDDPAVLETINNVSQLPSVKRSVHDTYVNMNADDKRCLVMRRMASKQKKYGDPFYTNRQKAFGKRKMTKPEKKLAEFLDHRNISYIHNYDCGTKNFDFAIFDGDRLAILVEIDGMWYHGLISDPDGRHVHGETDFRRFSNVPDGVKFVVCDENRIDECFAEMMRVFNMDYNAWIKEVIDSLPTEFPYPTYSDDRMRLDWKHLCEYETHGKRSFIGNSIISNFHPSIWEARVGHHMSPVQCWKDRSKLEKVVRNRSIYKSKLSSQQIATGFNVSKIAPKVSVFRATLAKDLVKKYLPNVSEVFDPFSGFSGRMLGVCATGKRYIGQDISKTHIDESNRIIEFLGLNQATVQQADVFKSTGKYESLFTCSPYKLKERWNDNETDLTCDQWIDVCLSRFDCKKYLFVVDHTEKYINNIVCTIGTISHITKTNEFVILIER